MKIDLSKYDLKQKWSFFFIILYLSLLVSFYLGENTTGGAFIDYFNQKKIAEDFSENFFNTLFSYDKYSTRHSPVLIIFLSIFEKIDLNDFLIRFIHLNLSLILPIYLFKTLNEIIKDKKVVFFLVSLIFISPTFRSLAIWPDSRILGLSFFVISIYEFIKFRNNRKYISCIKNIFFLSISAYLSPNFALFAIFYFLEFFSYYKNNFKYLLQIIFLNVFLSLPAFFYLFSLETNFLLKTAIVGIESKETLIFKNPFNKFLLIPSIIFFYLIPFYFFKILSFKTDKINIIKNVLLSSILFLICILFFDYKYEYTGGGVFFKSSYFLFKNNYLFYMISFVSLVFLVNLINFNINNFLLVLILILSNPQFTIYHKYYDPLMIVLLFTLFNIKFDINNFKKNKNFIYIFLYFLVFLIINFLKSYV